MHSIVIAATSVKPGDIAVIDKYIYVFTKTAKYYLGTWVFYQLKKPLTDVEALAFTKAIPYDKITNPLSYIKTLQSIKRFTTGRKWTTEEFVKDAVRRGTLNPPVR